MTTLVKVGLGFSVLITLIIPISILIYCIAIKKKIVKPFLVGCLAFFISQIVLRVPILNYVLPNQIWFIKLSTNPYLYGLFLGLTAGIFEEVARYIGFRYLLKNNRRYIDGLSFGFGHWGIEAVLITGINTFAILFLPIGQEIAATMTTTNAFLIGIERLLTMSIHIACSIIVLYAVKSSKIKYLFAAILLHTVVDAPIVILPALFNIGAIGMEIYLLIIALICLYIIFKLKDSIEKINTNSLN